MISSRQLFIKEGGSKQKKKKGVDIYIGKITYDFNSCLLFSLSLILVSLSSLLLSSKELAGVLEHYVFNIIIARLINISMYLRIIGAVIALVSVSSSLSEYLFLLRIVTLVKLIHMVYYNKTFLVLKHIQAS